MAKAKSKLSSLTENNSNLPIFSFPRDLGTSSRRLHSIQFLISTPEKANMKPSADSSQIDFEFSGGTQNQIEKATAFSGADFKDIYKYYLEPPAKIPASYIYLYMPDTVNENEQLMYNEISVTDVLPALSNSSEAYEQGKGVFSEIMSGSAGIQTITNNPFSSYIPTALAKRFGLGDAKAIQGINSLVLSKMGYASNPQLEVFFKGVGFRTFQFDFIFTPYNEDEAQAIRDIIHQFKYHSAPSFTDNSVGRFFVVPSMFDITYLFNGEPNKFLNKILPSCVLISVIVDHSPSGWSTFTDGMPVQTRLTLKFMEVDIVTKEKVDEGF